MDLPVTVKVRRIRDTQESHRHLLPSVPPRNTPRTTRPTFKMTQKMRKNGKNGPSQRNNVSITKPSADMVIQSAIQ